jgi:general stress protein YciG
LPASTFNAPKTHHQCQSRLSTQQVLTRPDEQARDLHGTGDSHEISVHLSSGEEVMNDQVPVLQNESSSSSPASNVDSVKKKRGFAVMDRMQVREIARRGGVAAHRAGTAHEFSSEEARIAGRKGGVASHSRPTEPRP